MSRNSSQANERHGARHDNGFVVDGYHRARAGADPEVRAQVMAEYAERLAAAEGFWQRFWLMREAEREIDRRLNKVASPYALY
jgi:hypothetical protein